MNDWIVVFLIVIAAAATLLLWHYLRRKRQPSVAAMSNSALEINPEAAELRCLIAECEVLAQRHRLRIKEISRRTNELERLDYAHMTPERLLKWSRPAERQDLASVLELTGEPSPARLVTAIREAGSHSVAIFIRKFGVGEKHVPYKEIAIDVALKLGVQGAESMALDKIERAAIESAFNRMLQEASPTQRQALLEELRRQQGQSYTGVGTAAGTLALANLSGFGLYAAASTVVGAVTSALGLTMPFAAYTGMSSALSVVMGPVGWLALAGWVAHKVGSPNTKKTIPAIMMVATVRARLMAKREQEINSLHHEQAFELPEAAKLKGMQDRISRLRG